MIGFAYLHNIRRYCFGMGICGMDIIICNYVMIARASVSRVYTRTKVSYVIRRKREMHTCTYVDEMLTAAFV